MKGLLASLLHGESLTALNSDPAYIGIVFCNHFGLERVLVEVVNLSYEKIVTVLTSDLVYPGILFCGQFGPERAQKEVLS